MTITAGGRVGVDAGLVDLTRLHDAVLTDMGQRAGRADFDRWQDQARSCGFCTRPIRLRGWTGRITADGEILRTYDTRHEPDGITYTRCGNRRASVCPSCSHEYQGDMWHLLYAGVAGGIKGVPTTVGEHTQAFVTVTAPSFGPVHTTRKAGGACHPRRGPARCPHGRPQSCRQRHADGDSLLGTPLCADCYDYTQQVVWQWEAPELWRRFTIQLRRSLADRLGLRRGQLDRHVRVVFAKVAEFQRRGVIHFHALIRIDGPTLDGQPYQHPTVHVPPELLAAAVTGAAGMVSVVSRPWEPGAPTWQLRFGQQIDIRPVHATAGRDDQAGPVHPGMVAAYIAKYATKGAEDSGLAPHRIDPTLVDQLRIAPHPKRIVQTAARIALRAQLTALSLEALHQLDPDQAQVLDDATHWRQLGRWLHMLGFRGHFATKSRTYSVSLGYLRAERRTHRRREATEPARPDSDDLDDDSTLVVGSWAFDGAGWLTFGDAALAVSAAARAREYRQLARDSTSANVD